VLAKILINKQLSKISRLRELPMSTVSTKAFWPDRNEWVKSMKFTIKVCEAVSFLSKDPADRQEGVDNLADKLVSPFSISFMYNLIFSKNATLNFRHVAKDAEAYELYTQAVKLLQNNSCDGVTPPQRLPAFLHFIFEMDNYNKAKPPAPSTVKGGKKRRIVSLHPLI